MVIGLLGYSMQLVFSAAPKHSSYLFRMARRETDPVRIYYYSHWSSFSNSPAGALSRRSFLIGGLIRLVPVSYRRSLILKRFRDALGTLTEQVKADASSDPPSSLGDGLDLLNFLANQRGSFTLPISLPDGEERDRSSENILQF